MPTPTGDLLLLRVHPDEYEPESPLKKLEVELVAAKKAGAIAIDMACANAKASIGDDRFLTDNMSMCLTGKPYPDPSYETERARSIRAHAEHRSLIIGLHANKYGTSDADVDYATINRQPSEKVIWFLTKVLGIKRIIICQHGLQANNPNATDVEIHNSSHRMKWSYWEEILSDLASYTASEAVVDSIIPFYTWWDLTWWKHSDVARNTETFEPFAPLPDLARWVGAEEVLQVCPPIGAFSDGDDGWFEIVARFPDEYLAPNGDGSFRVHSDRDPFARLKLKGRTLEEVQSKAREWARRKPIRPLAVPTISGMWD